MRKLFLAIALMAGLSTAQAQVFQQSRTADRSGASYFENASEMVAPGVKPYVKGGIVSADYVGENTGGIKDLWGFMVETGIQIPFKLRCLGLQTGLRYVQKGAKGPWDSDKNDMASVRQNVVEMPVLFTMILPAGRKGGVKLGMGCFASYGIGGKVVHGSHEYDTYGNPGFNARRFDIGPTMEIGYETRHFAATLGVETGAINVNENMGEARARALYLTAGYVF